MKLIVILIALVLERGLHAGDFLHRFNWFPCYLQLLRKSLASLGLWKGYAGVIIVLLPLVIITAIISCLLHHPLYGMLWVLFSIIVLLYCLGPKDLYTTLDRFFAAKIKGDPVETEQNLHTMTHFETNGAATVTTTRSVTESIFSSFNENIFAVLFWFFILGPTGAVLYRATSLLRRDAQTSGSEEAALSGSAQQLQEILDWIPARILGLIFALVGDFSTTFSYWIKHLYSGLSQTYIHLEKTGDLALHLTETETSPTSFEENKAALALIDRALVIFLVVVALFDIGSWLY